MVPNYIIYIFFSKGRKVLIHRKINRQGEFQAYHPSEYWMNKIYELTIDKAIAIMYTSEELQKFCIHYEKSDLED